MPDNAITKLFIAALVVVLVVVLWFSVERSIRMAQETETRARAACEAMGGEAILDYSYNSNQFYITGCKIRR